jgi:hypothetical protein
MHLDPITVLAQQGQVFAEPWHIIQRFEQTIAEFFGAPYAVATDCCTHALELVLRAWHWQGSVTVPCHTYMSVPMMLDKISVPYQLTSQIWQETYDIVPGRLTDAATLWRRCSYQPHSVMCVSFQFRKHLALGRGGMILLDNVDLAQRLRRMRHDGRDPDRTQWQQDITDIGYHYYMTPETAAQGLLTFAARQDAPYQPWGWQDYRDLRELSYFRNRHA